MTSVTHTFEHLILPEQAGSYFTLPFEIQPAELPEGCEKLTIRYDYPRHDEQPQPLPNGTFHARPEINIIDIGLLNPQGRQVGASGSDKSDFFISEVAATPGYQPCPVEFGRWEILLGAYKVAPGGVRVRFEVTLQAKQGRWLKGDLHTHTLASDGVHTLEELAWKAKRNGLDFVAVTDHNQFIATAGLPRLPGVTLIPGVEWTHYQGHANFMGVDRPYDEPFATNTPEEAQARFRSARQRGATIMINHPFDETCGFQFDLQQLEFDCIEVWNGPMRESNLRAVGFWQQLLAAGKKVPACGGSDYHRDTPFIFLGGPSMGVFSLSAGAGDILKAVRPGHSYIVFAPNCPQLALTAGDKMMGDSLPWAEVKEMEIEASGLLAGDVLRVVTGRGAEVIFQAPTDGGVHLVYPMAEPGFARVEILRAFLPGLPMLPALLSNPLYFDA